MFKRLFGVFAVLAAMVGLPSVAGAQIYTPKGPIEAKYIQPGPWAVAQSRTTEACDYKGNICTIYYPERLGSNPLKGMTQGFMHPVIAWANGTGQATSQYELILRHWASWGFVVISTDDTDTGGGTTVTNATEYLVALGDRPTSIFYRKIDRTRIGVSGHSQGGAAAIGLFVRRPDLFKTAIPYNAANAALSLALGWANPLQLNAVTSGSIFHLGGALDPVADPSSQLTYYLTTASQIDKALGVLSTSGHDAIVNVRTCDTANCLAGRGYPTAWMMWKLEDATDGPDAFRAGSGEFSRLHPLWALSLSNTR